MNTFLTNLSPLQQALYERLNSILSPGNVGVLDHSIENRSFPYASIGEFEWSDAGTKSVAIVEVVARIHVWSEAEGYKECESISDTILSSLTSTELTVPGHTLLLLRSSGASTPPEWNGTNILRHEILTLRWLLS